MPVQTRNQTRQQKINEQQLASTDEPVIMAADEPAAGKPPCYLAWGRFLTEKEYHASGGKTAKEVTTMMASKEKPYAKGPLVKQEEQGTGSAWRRRGTSWLGHHVTTAVKAARRTQLGDVDPMTAATFALGFVAEQGQTETHDECAHCPQETTHGLAWTANVHYMSIGGQCGQSCGCCRADVYKSGLDEDAKWGACSICLST